MTSKNDNTWESTIVHGSKSQKKAGFQGALVSAEWRDSSNPNRPSWSIHYIETVGCLHVCCFVWLFFLA